MRSISEIKQNSTQLLALTSLKVGEFDNILLKFSILWEKYHKYHNLQGKKRKLPKFNEDKRSSLSGSEMKLFFVLYCLKNNTLQEHNAFTFDMSQSKLSQWLKILIPILETSLADLKVLPARTQEELDARISELKTTMFWVDASEREVPRLKDTDTQKATFSVKKHKNSVKNTLLCQENQEILFLGITQEGALHDITLLREDEIILPKDSTLLQDLGYQGHCPENVTVIMPYKKPKNQELELNEKILNVWISSCRIVVEHAIAGVKRMRCVLDEIRLRTTDILDTVMLIACGLHNFRVKSRS